MTEATFGRSARQSEIWRRIGAIRSMYESEGWQVEPEVGMPDHPDVVALQAEYVAILAEYAAIHLANNTHDDACTAGWW